MRSSPRVAKVPLEVWINPPEQQNDGYQIQYQYYQHCLISIKNWSKLLIRESWSRQFFFEFMKILEVSVWLSGVEVLAFSVVCLRYCHLDDVKAKSIQVVT